MRSPWAILPVTNRATQERVTAAARRDAGCWSSRDGFSLTCSFAGRSRGRTINLAPVTTPPARGLSAVVAYKLGTAVIELLGVVAVLVLHAVLGMDLGALSGSIERHWLHGIGAMLADMVRLVAGGEDTRLIVFALGGDAVSSAVEGLLLQRGYRWARWVILGSTGLPLPWELDRLVRQPSVVRLALLLVNVAILGWVWWARPGAEAGVHRGLRHIAKRGAIVAVTAIGVWLLLSYRLIPLVERHHHIVAAAASSAGRTTDAAGIRPIPSTSVWSGRSERCNSPCSVPGGSPPVPSPYGARLASSRRSRSTAPIRARL